MAVKIIKPTSDAVDRMNSNLFDEQISHAVGCGLKRILKLQGLNDKALEGRIRGMSVRWFLRHCDMGFGRSRHLHIIAALTWISQIPLRAVFCDLREFWRKEGWQIGANAFEILMRVVGFGAADFEAFISECIRWGIVEPRVVGYMDELANLSDGDFACPYVLDVDAFGYDYYRSIGKVLVELRTENNITIEEMAWILGLEPEKYEGYEQPVYGRTIPHTLGARIIVGLSISDSSVFLKYMEDFSAFKNARRVQELRTHVLECFDEAACAKLMDFTIAFRDCITSFRRDRFVATNRPTDLILATP